jgi:hypothetical protein
VGNLGDEMALIPGHYIGWTRKEATLVASGEEEWYKFDGESFRMLNDADHLDDKVSIVKA